MVLESNEKLTILAELASKERLLLVGAVAPSYGQDVKRFERWLDDGNHAGMTFMERHREVRADPRRYFEPTRTVLVFCMSYRRDEFFNAVVEPRVAGYAQYRDYHTVLKRRCESVMQGFHEHVGSETPYRVAVDTAPVLERALAAQASRGFIGKNTLWIHPDYGSMVLLAEVFTALDFDIDAKAPIPLDRKTADGGCGPCRQCQVHCPTGALDAEYRLDARRCLAYWTIENRGTIPEEYWPHLAQYYFGCDLCQTACPYNIKPRRNLLPPSDLKVQLNWNLFTVATMDEGFYQRNFGGTPLTRAKRSGLRRNALIAMAVTSDPRLEEALQRVDVDGGSPLVETVAQIRDWLVHRPAQASDEVLGT